MGQGEIEVRNPVSGDVLAHVPDSTPEQVCMAVERARSAQAAWAALDDKARAQAVRRWGDELWRSRDALMNTIRQETGKNETGALLEVIVLDNILDYYAHYAPRILRPKTRRALFPVLQRVRVYYRPHGVVGIISPWNYPYLLALIDAAPALAAGNAVVIKPSEITPLSALAAVEAAYRVGIPRDVIQVVTGGGATGAALVDYVDCIEVTGSTATGRKVAQRAGERLIPAGLELGGKDPLIVLEDVDIDVAASAALQGATENAGQVCISTERIYVVDAVYDRFVARLVDYAQRLVMGSGNGLGVHVGSMTNERELLRCEAQIADAVEKGARVLFGGKRRPDLGPLFLEPAVLVDVNHTMDVMREETFGPLIPVMRVKDAEEAIRWANDGAYGLSGAVFTRDLKRGERLARQIASGDVSVNRTQFGIATPSLPMGGSGASGLGRRNGPEGLLRFVQSHAVLIDRGWLNRPGLLTLLDPGLYRAFKALRVLRRWIPWLRASV
jgi:acyl-CoA reductase-like NAD-dependent aldehyde dehydrogenase